MSIDQQSIDEIINRTDLVDLIGKSLKLRKSGSNYFACCPFHNEKTPSFSVNAKNQFFHCFGCGESGNAITFIMKYYGYDFVEAIKQLGHNCGLPIEDTNEKLSFEHIKLKKQRKLTISDILNKAAKFYQDSLTVSKHALDYLYKRGLSAEIIDMFMLGYAPESYTTLSQVFNDYKNNQSLQSSGLIAKNDDRLYDRFRNRIIFPIRNIRGEVIAFGGRTIKDQEPKYINSPETELFNKTLELYGLFEGQKAIRDRKFTIVVEGYMDVIALQQFGISNVVATMGTSVTEEHIKKLLRLCDDIYFCFDGDEAGKKAAWRALERSVPIVTDLKIVHFMFLPKTYDPDSYIREFGSVNFTNNIKDSSLTLTKYLLLELSQLVSLKSEEGKAKLISLAKPYIEQIKSVALQVMLKKQLSILVDLDPIVLESILNNRSRYAFYNSRINKREVAKLEKLPLLKVNKIKLIINSAVRNIDWVHNYKLPDSIGQYPTELQELILLLDFISYNYTKEDHINVGDILEEIDFNLLDVAGIMNSKIRLSFSEVDFVDTLQNLFGFVKSSATKIPKIPMRNVYE